MVDAVEVVVTLKAPEAATGFRIDSLFLSAEFEEKVGKAGTDKFYILLNPPITTGGEPKVINYGPCVSPELYFDAAIAMGVCKISCAFINLALAVFEISAPIGLDIIAVIFIIAIMVAICCYHDSRAQNRPVTSK